MSLVSGIGLPGVAANVATGLFVVMIGIQILLAAGVLPVSIAWGGRQTELTPRLRVSSLVAAVLLGGFAYVIRYRAGLLGAMPIPMLVRVGSWVVTGFLALNTLGNFASASKTEKLLFGPITAVLTVACLIVSLSKVGAGT